MVEEDEGDDYKTYNNASPGIWWLYKADEDKEDGVGKVFKADEDKMCKMEEAEGVGEVDGAVEEAEEAEGDHRSTARQWIWRELMRSCGLGDIEIWEVHNRGGQPHPFHLHPVQFQILDRNGQPSTSADLGWKDTVLVPPGDLVRIIMAFDRYADPQVPYMYHCHILEHEDNGMMGQFLVVEEPEQLSLVTGKTTVVTFITGVQCGHCYEHARLFDEVLRENDINLVIITPESDPDQERVAALSSSLISDTAGKWAGWFGMAHTGPAHGTVLLDETGEVVLEIHNPRTIHGCP